MKYLNPLIIITASSLLNSSYEYGETIDHSSYRSIKPDTIGSIRKVVGLKKSGINFG